MFAGKIVGCVEDGGRKETQQRQKQCKNVPSNTIVWG